MKWFKISLLLGLIPFYSIAQAPQKIGYQAVIRNANNTLLVSKPIGLKISILTGSSNPVSVYEETQKTNTNVFGLISLQIGAGKVVSGAMNKIDWGKGQFYVKTDIDPEGGSNYILFGITELTSVPYALFALNSGISQEVVSGGTVPGPQGERGLTGETGIQGTSGSTGLNGLNGSDGIDGIDGAAGIAGTTGLAGAIGPTGLRGAQGLSGATGDAGDVGPSGTIGLTGIQGPAGSNGVAGPQEPEA